MKKYLLLISMLLFMGAAFAQPGKKPPVKEKPPTQKKVNELEELQKEMDELSPEEKKEMEKIVEFMFLIIHILFYGFSIESNRVLYFFCCALNLDKSH